jgi:hypothetical protein
MSVHGFGRNFLHTNGRMFGRATANEAEMRKAAAEGKRVLHVTPDGWFSVDADGNKTPVERPVDPMKYVSEGGRIETPNWVMYRPVGYDDWAATDAASTITTSWQKGFTEKFVSEGESPVESPEGKEVTIYILLFRDDGYPQHTHYISPHGSLGEAKAAVRKTRFTAKVWKANSDKEWHLSDSAHEGTWIIRESHVRINGE